MISFLIGTYKDRKRSVLDTINSILSKKFLFDFEIIITTTDGSKIEPFPNKKIKYFINDFKDNWGQYYKFLFKQATKKYIYYLEDDDQLLTNFSFLIQESNYDYYFGKFKSHPKHDKIIEVIKEFKIAKKLKTHDKIFRYFNTPEKFKTFQLSQILIKKDIINIQTFPVSNNKYNDYYLFKNNPGSIKFIPIFFYLQGWDGKNVSIK